MGAGVEFADDEQPLVDAEAVLKAGSHIKSAAYSLHGAEGSSGIDREVHVGEEGVFLLRDCVNEAAGGKQANNQAFHSVVFYAVADAGPESLFSRFYGARGPASATAV